MNKKIMILGASILQLPAIKAASEMGLDVVVVDMNPDAVGFNVPNVCKEVISTIDIDAIVTAAKKHHINGIMTLATDMPMRSVAAVAKEMNLVGIDEQTAIKATNKAEMRKALFEAGVPIPRFYKVSNKKEYIEAAKRFSEPFIVKPADSSGSRGIYMIRDLNNTSEIESAYEYSHEFSRNGDVVVEEYMFGPEVSVETLSFDGLCHVIQITDKLTTGAPHFVEMGHSQPSMLPDNIKERIKEVAIAANKAIGINNGPSHTEIIITKEGPKIVELGARLGGDCITSHLVPLSTGVDMVKACIKIALGEEPEIRPKYANAAAIRYFEQHAGVINSIEGLEKARSVKGVQQVTVVHGVGERITDVDSSGSRMGFVIAKGDEPKSAILMCQYALNNIKVLIQ